MVSWEKLELLSHLLRILPLRFYRAGNELSKIVRNSFSA